MTPKRIAELRELAKYNNGHLDHLLFVECLDEIEPIIQKVISASDAESCQLISDMLRDLVLTQKCEEHITDKCQLVIVQRNELARERDEAREAAQILRRTISKWVSDRPAHNRDDHNCELCMALEETREKQGP